MKRILFSISVLFLSLAVTDCNARRPVAPTAPAPVSMTVAAPVETATGTPTLQPTTSIPPTLPDVTPQQAIDTPLAKDSAYDALLEKVKRSDPTVNFTEFRMAYAKTSMYDPYGFSLAGLRDSVAKALDDKDFELALKLANQMLDQNYIYPEAHIAAIRACEGLGQKECVNFHRRVLNGMIDSILNSGDGKSPKSAYVVVLIDEEYLILGVLNIQNNSQGVTDSNGHSYDVFDGTDLKMNKPVTIYFNIDIPFHSLNGLLKP